MELTESSSEKIENIRLGKIISIGILAIVLIISILVGISLGATRIPIGDILNAFINERSSLTYKIIYNIRMPRVLTGMLVGMCLAVSGGILQGVMRNSLASPSLIGVTSGAGLAATICIVMLPHYESLTPIAGFVGALLTTILIYVLSWKDGIQPLRMVLAGIAISSLISSIINLILIFFPDRVSDTLSYTIGSLNLVLWSEFYTLLPYAIVGISLAMIFSKKINILMLGDEIATTLGVNVELARFFFIALASLLAASSVSIVGLLGFVGLIVPHITKILIGSDYKYLFPATALLGGTIVIICDTVARVIFAPMEIPVGIVMAILGVPFFLFLLRGGVKHD